MEITEQQIIKSKQLFVGDILVNELSYKDDIPPKYFKCLSIDSDFGVVGFAVNGRKDTIGIANVRKANLFEKISCTFMLFYKYVWGNIKKSRL